MSKASTEKKINTEGKTKISRSEFEKRYEIEYCWQVRWEYLEPEEAQIKARKIISENYFYETK